MAKRPSPDCFQEIEGIEHQPDPATAMGRGPSPPVAGSMNNKRKKVPGLSESSCPADPMKLFEHTCAAGVVANLVQARENVG